MGKDIKIRNSTYLGAEEVSIPLADGSGNAKFIDPSGSTLTSGNQMLEGVASFDADGVPVTGQIPNRTAADLTAAGPAVNVPAGNYAQAVSKQVAGGSASTPATTIQATPEIMLDSTTGEITAEVDASQGVTPAVTPGYVQSGTAGTVRAQGSDTLQLPTKAAATITPTTTDQEIAAGQFLTGKQTVKGDPNLVPSKIVYPYSIFGIEGAAQLPVIAYDDTSKVLSIS